MTIKSRPCALRLHLALSLLLCAGPASALTITTAGTTATFDENLDATNTIETENPAGTLATFQAAVQTAFNNDLGGVVDWETGVTASASSGPSSNNTVTTVDVAYGAGGTKTLQITFDRTMELYTNDIAGQVEVLSRQGSFHNAILPQGTSPTSVLFSMSFSGANVTELGAAMPSRSTYNTGGVTFRLTANFSGGGSAVIDDTIGGTKGTDDTFFHFAAPAGEFITSLDIAYLDDNGQALANGQRRPILDDFGFIAEDALLPPDAVATGLFDENVEATNTVDVENPPGTLAAFQAAVLNAFNNDLGGVIDWETGVSANPSSGPSPNNALTEALVGYGAGGNERLSVVFDDSMDLYTNDINFQIDALSQSGSYENALIASGGNDPKGLQFTMTFGGAPIIETGLIIPSRTTFGASGVDFRVTAAFSGGGSSMIDDTIGGTPGTDDTFFHFAAPGGQTITSLTVAYLDDNGQGLSNGQRRPVMDDFGFILAAGGDTFADWIDDFPGVGAQTAIDDDPDGDGQDSGVENFFGTDPSTFSEGLLAGAPGSGTFTFTHPQGTLASDLTASYQWSKDLQTFLGNLEADGAGTTVEFTTTPDSPTPGSTTVTATVTGPSTDSLYVRVLVE